MQHFILTVMWSALKWTHCIYEKTVGAGRSNFKYDSDSYEDVDLLVDKFWSITVLSALLHQIGIYNEMFIPFTYTEDCTYTKRFCDLWFPIPIFFYNSSWVYNIKARDRLGVTFWTPRRPFEARLFGRKGIWTQSRLVAKNLS